MSSDNHEDDDDRERSMSGRKPIVAVFGSNAEINPAVDAMAEGLGRLIVDLGCRLCCGGRGGVMESVSRGASKSGAWTGGEVIGIMPEADDLSANPHLDIVLPTGLGLFRNMLVARTGDACIGIAGGAGTLSEIAFAWQIGKPVATMAESGGWSGELAGRHLDHRREAPIEALNDLSEAEAWLRSVLPF